MATNPDDAQPNDEPAATLPAVRKAELVANEDRGYIVPRTMEEAYRYAVAVVNAGLAPASYGRDPKDWNSPPDPQKVMIGIAAALEAGLPPMYGLRNIAIINNRPTIWGDAAMALIQQRGMLANQTVREIGTSVDTDATPREQWPDDYGFVVSLWRKSQADPYVGKFTVGDAKRAGLWMNAKKKPWFEHPKRMLMIRARSFPQRDGFADALAGLAIREEVEDTHEPEKLVTDTSFLDDDTAPAEPGNEEGQN